MFQKTGSFVAPTLLITRLKFLCFAVSFDGEHLTLEEEVRQIGRDRFSDFRTIACCSAAKAVGSLVAARIQGMK